MAKDCPVVTLSYSALCDGAADCGPELEQAFGPDGLGLLTVKDVPCFAQCRAKLLPLVAKFAALPDSVKALYEQPDVAYTIGWSQGKEQLSNGKLDVHKGSYYANPSYDLPDCEESLRSQYPDFYGANIWPTEHLPELEPAFKQLGQIMVQTGLLLAAKCDRYLRSHLVHTPPSSVSELLSASQSTKARLLHYGPPLQAEAAHAAAPAPALPDSWCGWHTDHGALTGLTSAMYIAEEEVPAPDPSAGLYIKTRKGNVVQVCIPEDHIGFQVGEVLQVMSGGALMATPHCVRAPSGQAAAGISRNTLAVFLQPDLDYVMQLPEGAAADGMGVSRWAPGMPFGQFCKNTLRTYYSM